MRKRSGKHCPPPRQVLPPGLRRTVAKVLPFAILGGTAAATAVALPASGTGALASPDVPVIPPVHADPQGASAHLLAVHAAVRVHHHRTTVTVQRGDTLSALAKSHCGKAGAWPHLWSANHSIVGDNPNLITPGEHLKMWCHAAVLAHLTAVVTHRTPAASPPAASPPARPSSGGKVWGVTYGYPDHCGDGDGDGWDESCAKLHPQQAAPAEEAPAAAAPAPARVSVSGTLNASGMSSFEQCVIRAESGGNPVAQNPSSTASGLFGFLSTTWTAVTGLPGPARDYSVATQDAAFSKLYAEAGASPWAAYDGC